MARRVEEDEGYWPGFVDALATIVMVVTFLLIILGVAIFAISTQVSKAVADNQAATAKAKAEIAESQQQVQEQTAQAKAALAAAIEAQQAADAAAAQVEETQQSTHTEVSRLETALAEQANQAQMVKAQLQATLQTMSEQTQALKAQAEQLVADQQQAATLAQEAEAAKEAAEAANDVAEAVSTDLAKTKEALEDKEKQVSQLSQTVATLSEAAAAEVTQVEQVEAENALRISSNTVVIEPSEIEVTAEQVDWQAEGVEVTSALEVLTVRFAEGAIDFDPDAALQAQAFVETNRSVLDKHLISLWSFYDGSSLSLTQAKRTAYFRMLAVRNVLLTAGFDPADIEVSVRAADQPADVDTVQTFLQNQPDGSVQ